jgi:hypothetical protein
LRQSKLNLNEIYLGGDTYTFQCEHCKAWLWVKVTVTVDHARNWKSGS